MPVFADLLFEKVGARNCARKFYHGFVNRSRMNESIWWMGLLTRIITLSLSRACFTFASVSFVKQRDENSKVMLYLNGIICN